MRFILANICNFKTQTYFDLEQLYSWLFQQKNWLSKSTYREKNRVQIPSHSYFDVAGNISSARWFRLLPYAKSMQFALSANFPMHTSESNADTHELFIFQSHFPKHNLDTELFPKKLEARVGKRCQDSRRVWSRRRCGTRRKGHTGVFLLHKFRRGRSLIMCMFTVLLSASNAMRASIVNAYIRRCDLKLPWAQTPREIFTERQNCAIRPRHIRFI